MTELKVPLPNRRATRLLAQRLARVSQPGDLLILNGALGAGKTFLVRAFLRALGLSSNEPVTSPTFALVQDFPTRPRVVHADLYRLSAPEQADELGLIEARDDGAILVVEWGRPFVSALGGDAMDLEIQLSPRIATLQASGNRSAMTLVALSESLPLPSPRRRQD